MNARNFGIGAGLGSIGAGLAGMFGNQENPYDAASKFYNRIPGQTKPYYQPYINAGQGALGALQGQYGNLLGNYPGLQQKYNQLMNDPNGFINQIGSGYQKSPGFDWQMNQGMQAQNNAAAAGGMLGSPQHQQMAAQTAEGIANQDYYNYLNKALGAFGMGLQGNQGLYGAGLEGEQGLNKMGFESSDQMARILADLAAQQGQMSFAGTAAQNQQQGANWGNLFSGLGTLAAFW
jgi:hypothetical protein